MPEGPALEIAKQPMGGNVNAPASGTYGEKASLTSLQGELPPMQEPGRTGQPGLPQVSPEPPSALPPQREGRPGTSAALPPGIPSVLAAPTDMPQVPVSTPLAGPAGQPTPMSGAQRRLQILDQLAEDPQVSDETREWAKSVRRVIVE